MKRGFTLIELLVVIAIIAILAAILFPVFAQAKTAAKVTTELTSAQEIGVAFQLYATDYDDYSATVSKAPIVGLNGSMTGDNGKPTVASWTYLLQPYSKSWQMYLSPVRSDSFQDVGGVVTDPFKCYDNTNPTGRCLGFGYDDGLVSDAGYGMLNTQTTDSNGFNLRAGRNLSSIDEPANMVAFGSSNDNPGYSVAMDNILSRYPDGISSKAIRFSGRFQYGFADSHAKLVRMLAGEYPNYGLVSIPTSKQDAYKWCFSRTFVPDPGYDGGTANPAAAGDYPLQSNQLSCTAAVDDLYANTVVTP